MIDTDNPFDNELLNKIGHLDFQTREELEEALNIFKSLTKGGMELPHLGPKSHGDLSFGQRIEMFVDIMYREKMIISSEWPTYVTHYSLRLRKHKLKILGEIGT